MNEEQKISPIPEEWWDLDKCPIPELPLKSEDYVEFASPAGFYTGDFNGIKIFNSGE